MPPSLQGKGSFWWSPSQGISFPHQDMFLGLPMISGVPAPQPPRAVHLFSLMFVSAMCPPCHTRVLTLPSPFKQRSSFMVRPSAAPRRSTSTSPSGQGDHTATPIPRALATIFCRVIETADQGHAPRPHAIRGLAPSLAFMRTYSAERVRDLGGWITTLVSYSTCVALGSPPPGTTHHQTWGEGGPTQEVGRMIVPIYIATPPFNKKCCK